MGVKTASKGQPYIRGMATVCSWGAGEELGEGPVPLSSLSGSDPVSGREILKEIVCFPNYFLYPSHIGSLLLTDHQNIVEKD